MLKRIMIGVVLCMAIVPAFGSRQYYSSWAKHPTHNYHYRSYYYKPTLAFVGFKHHYIVCPPRSRYLYFYNPYTRRYWGRCSVSSGGEQPLYSKLEPEKQQSTIGAIKEEDFPKPAAFPAIPESNDGVSMDAPPDDLPSEETPAS